LIFLIDATKPMFSEDESAESSHFKISLEVWWKHKVILHFQSANPSWLRQLYKHESFQTKD
jgi:hypothetical protein